MAKYTTGELANLADISVRAVQYYDRKELLKPSALTEGGKRQYSENDLKKLQLIVYLKQLGLSLTSIKKILSSRQADQVLHTLLQEQKRLLNERVSVSKKQLRLINQLDQGLASSSANSLTTIDDMKQIMTSKKHLSRVHAKMILLGIAMDIIEIGTLVLGISSGIWWPFILGMVLVFGIGYYLFQYYYQQVNYICPICQQVFKPQRRQVFFAKHTPKTRELTCTHCGETNLCIETGLTVTN